MRGSHEECPECAWSRDGEGGRGKLSQLGRAKLLGSHAVSEEEKRGEARGPGLKEHSRGSWGLGKGEQARGQSAEGLLEGVLLGMSFCKLPVQWVSWWNWGTKPVFGSSEKFGGGRQTRDNTLWGFIFFSFLTTFYLDVILCLQKFTKYKELQNNLFAPFTLSFTLSVYVFVHPCKYVFVHTWEIK